VALKSSDSGDILDTEYVKKVISEHAETAAILLLPGIQYYSGQFLDIPTITAFARSKGIFVIWDLAHAVGNVPLSLHDWDVDAAAWCSYKYLNGGPGCIGGLFVHERNSRAPDPSVGTEDSEMQPARNRFAGWWGNDKSTRFAMTPGFHPVAGAAGFQLSNPSVLDITSLCASLEVFELAGGLAPLRAKSLQLTGYLERELYRRLSGDLRQYWRVITPRESERRGAQLSLLLADGLLERVMARLEEQGVLVDERRPNVIRVAPAPLYNTYQDCFDFVGALENALRSALKD
jgi:kynureninase